MDILYSAAQAWQNLLPYRYEITCGKSKKLHRIILVFDLLHFYHLAGFPHLHDIVLPIQFSRAKLLGKILAGDIAQTDIERSGNYQSIVRPKLEALSALEQVLSDCRHAYRFDSKRLPFYTDIKAHYLLTEDGTRVVFVFADANTADDTCFLRSAFIMGGRDFRTNQPKMTVLRITRTNTATGQTDVLYQKQGFAPS
jgi:hypothetical protein